MLGLLHIENIAIIKSADIELDSGFNILTGETGAGKSIIIDCICAVTGGRVSRDFLREGAEKGYICAVFYNVKKPVLDMLEEFGIDSDEESLSFSREIRADGKSVCRINNFPVTAAVMKSIGTALVSVHSQHETYGLLDEKNHISLLDSFAENQDVLEEYKAAFSDYDSLKKELEKLQENSAENARLLDRFSYEIAEIEGAQLSTDEEEKLLSRREFLRNGENIINAFSLVQSIFSGNDDSIGICSALAQASSAMSGFKNADGDISALCARVEDLRYTADDIYSDISRTFDNLEFSPQELEDIEARLDTIYKLKRKYGANIEEILSYCDKIKAQFELISSAENDGAALTAKLDGYKQKAEKLALKLSESRKKAAEKLSKEVTKELAELDMKNAEFAVNIESNIENLSVNGINEVVFMIAANAGESSKPLSKVASGGELSRIMLAIRSIITDDMGAETIIFDEIDAGVSGQAAARVGEKLYSVSRKRQTLCITHLAQIAVFADRHLRVSKKTENERTVSFIETISGTELKNELSRIISGREITAATIKTAEEMLSAAQRIKGVK